MSIPQAVPGLIPQLVEAVLQQISWENASAAANFTEACFYTSLRTGVMGAHRLTTWIRDTSVAYVSEIQTVFNLVNFSLIAVSAAQLVGHLQEAYQFSYDTDGTAIWGLKSTLVVATVASAAWLIWKGVERFRTMDPPQNHECKPEQGQPFNVTQGEKMSTEQRIGAVLQTTKAVFNLALACFVENRLWFLASFGMATYSLWKNLQIRWLTFTRVVNQAPSQERGRPHINQLTFTYTMMLAPNTQEPGECPICFDESAADTALCVNHLVCKTCLPQHILSKANTFVDYNSITKHITDHYRNGVHTHTSYAYRALIGVDKMPKCPTCNDAPLQNILDIEVRDVDHGTFNASVTIERPPVSRRYLFDKLYAIYNTAQAGLAFLQTYPTMAATIYTIQQWMIVTDIAGWTMTSYYLFDKINAKINKQKTIEVSLIVAIGMAALSAVVGFAAANYKLSTVVLTAYALGAYKLYQAVQERYNTKNIAAMKYGVVAGVVVGAALTIFITFQIQAYLQSTIVLQEVLNQLDLAPDVLKTLSVGFGSQLMHRVIEAIALNRLVSSILLTSLSDESRPTNMVSIAAQIATVWGVGTLQWIQVVQTLENPLQKIVESGGTLDGLDTSYVKRVETTYQFLVSSSCFSHIQSTLKSITDFTTRFFDKSYWDRFWWIHKRNGIETGRTVAYDIFLKDQQIDPCGCSLIPSLTDAVTTVWDRFQGVVTDVSLHNLP